MDDITHAQKQFYIRAIESLAENRSHVLKHGNSFAIFDRLGNMRPLGVRDHGLFCDGTRFLSRLVVDLDGTQLLLLSSAVSENKELLGVDTTNPDLTTSEERQVGQYTLHVRRTMFLWDNVYYEQINLRNHGANPIRLPLTVRYEADFVDIFEVRGMLRSQRGELQPPRVQNGTVLLGYYGLDNILRQTRVTFTPPPSLTEAHQSTYWIDLAHQEQYDISLTIACEYPPQPNNILAHEQAHNRVRATQQQLQSDVVSVESSNHLFNDWVECSKDDILMMLTETAHGLYPYAGVPWFSTVFGRDAIIAALATLWWYPAIARGVLAYLAAYQAQTLDPSRDAEPGKILHEQRRGEMANTGEIPFGNYYGSIDSTPLFVVLAGRYYEQTGDRAFITQIWPAIDAALKWIDTCGDRDGDGFVEYDREAQGGLRNQGWKDSDDSIFYTNGDLAQSPLALCEVQGYVYEAKVLAARMAEALAQHESAITLRQQAESLRRHFHQAFWCAEIDTYALALDGNKQPCRVRSSNAGHCLFSGIADEAHAGAIARQIMQDDFWSGWGIRTIPMGEARYNPMSYHNGSIWPHDNALIAAGLSRYGHKAAAVQVLSGLFDTSRYFELRRLPELFCGFPRRQREGPTLYPVACLPQAWASTSVFMLLQACLGLSIDGGNRRITLTNPHLPAWLPQLTLRNIQVGTSSVDIALHQYDQDVSIHVLHNKHEVEVVTK